MNFIFDERPSDSPFVKMIWRTQSEADGGSFISLAESHWEMMDLTAGFAARGTTLDGLRTVSDP